MPKEKKINFQSLELRNLEYSYAEKEKLIFNKINIKVKKGQKIGIVGKTGVSKSTLMNIMIGLIKPTKGNILINKNNLHKSEKNLSQWFNTISHVSQDTFILNGTILTNICFGEDIKDIDWERLELAAKKAKIDKFINSKRKKFFTEVGMKKI